ncbi:hypothetical protein [Prosthecobacter vanneervenii]|uniref:Uncharacterized protein n=1 Tax=Prosthecobacter vanneervenii TaxID=48466 RepID=A0A7W7Y7M5_9BACT|nr:hypothetical protein [Prosthecobacter vanneervenii]MBB5030970.1 hypothetical protein [Prosthecobacter vanneervenii]
MSRSLILSANYAGKSIELPETFLRSIASTATKSDVVLIANHGTQGDQARLEKLLAGARIWVPIPKQRYRVFRRLANTFRPFARIVAAQLREAWRKRPERRPLIEHKAAYLLNITCSRYFLARQFLLHSDTYYDHVMLSDSRDVVFQRDPFDSLSDGVTTGLESVLVKEQAGNVGWLRLLYGDDSSFPMESVLNQKVICSGVTLGDTASVAAYLEKVCAEFMERLPRMIHTPYLDQGVHIGLLRTGRIEHANMVSNGQEEIATLGTSDLSEFTINDEGCVFAANGRLVRIVHQYDRHPTLAQKILARFSSNM